MLCRLIGLTNHNQFQKFLTFYDFEFANIVQRKYYLITLFTFNLHLQNPKTMNKKTELKWKKIKKEKEQNNDSTTAINFKTHQLSQSDAEIIVPKQYPEFVKHNQILIIECGKVKVLVQVSAFNNSMTSTTDRRQVQQKSEISVLKTLLDIEGIQRGPTGMFKGQIRILNQSKIADYNLQIVQFLVKETYFSRRDQYKVMKALKESVTHIFLKKTLYFDQIALQVNAMMRNNQTIVKSGIIDKNTKLIFRTSCSKLSIGIQLSIQTFQLNQNKELYLQKMLQFLYIYLQRTSYVNATHRLSLVLFGRCFYPQFQTLQAAYDYLLKQNTVIEDQERFQTNFAVALQKDYQGRIFQDVYRRIIWSSDMIDNFRQFFWEKISQFLFTLNWDCSDNLNTIGKFITKSLQNKIEKTVEDTLRVQLEDAENIRVKPFIHKLKSKLAYSKDTNIFQAISLLSEQYKHHYIFRSLTETGNTIIILSAGDSEYVVDQSSYKMAKSYVFLTNVYCSYVNFRNKIDAPLKANIIQLQKKPIFQGGDKIKLENMEYNCIQEQVYISSTKKNIQYRDYFCNKSMVYPEELIKTGLEQSKLMKQQHNCSKELHFKLFESVILQNKKDYKTKEKLVSFISAHSMDDRRLYIHQLLYDKLNIYRWNKNTSKPKNTELDFFEADLDKIIITKKQWGIEKQQNQINKKLQNYRLFIENNQQRADSKEKTNAMERFSKAIFKLSNDIEQNFNNQVKFETMSNHQISLPKNNSTQRHKRKNSDYYHSDIINLYDQEENHKGKVNIFEQTYRNKNHQYNAGEKKESKVKKYNSHNKERVKNNFLESNIHYIQSSFSDNILNKLKAFIKKQYIEELKDQQEQIGILFQAERIWKNLLFPLLYPIFTKYKENFKEREEHLDTGVIDEANDKKISILEDQICKLVTKNYQIEQTATNYNSKNMVTKLSKGHVSCHLKMNGINLSRSYVIDRQKQERIIPEMLYRYLCYEDKDCRFCTKYVYFQDKNYYSYVKRKNQQTKSVKIVLAYDDSTNNEMFNSFAGSVSDFGRDSGVNNTNGPFGPNKRDPFLDFIKLFNEKYKQFSIDLTLTIPKIKPKTKKVVLNFSKKQSRALYHHEEAEIFIATEYNPRNLFQILISWNLCSSVIINEFVGTVMTIGRRSKLKPSLVSSGNIFETIWNITTLGEICFQNRISLDLLEQNILEAGEWLWDSNDYYFHISGISYIQFNKEKNLILWRDNNNEKRYRDFKKDDSSKQYNKFFKKAAVFDFLGGIISDAVYMSERKIKNYI